MPACSLNTIWKYSQRWPTHLSPNLWCGQLIISLTTEASSSITSIHKPSLSSLTNHKFINKVDTVISHSSIYKKYGVVPRGMNWQNSAGTELHVDFICN
ncbi:hypothetical protein CHARACLAT_007024 [Characodon lateralis]|uniref:Uncharacterized protein n=1 Tax=Characodon lateralis TaxID=208331 RepID=A0ABU7F381_9TELE|nr:hypothetical protein [Characodon lateralis]